MRLLAQLVGVVLLVGFVGAYFCWSVAALTAVAPVYLESAGAVTGSDEQRVLLRMPGRSGPAHGCESTAVENVARAPGRPSTMSTVPTDGDSDAGGARLMEPWAPGAKCYMCDRLVAEVSAWQDADATLYDATQLAPGANRPITLKI